MPCWYYEKKELKNTPSFLDGIDPNTEARYRREGARFIFDAGTKMGLRYDSCATGVVYFHRFYMFHSFKEFHRYVTGACCLFLAGKVEETPKKCKDIIKTCRGLLTEQQFAVFGEDPREEVMTLERILLQTIKFDLQVEHPYSRLLHYAKLVKGDKQKIQKVVQMAWTFVNDSMCTMLSLQWEPDIISVAMLYLATRLSKLDIQDWVGKPPGSKLKWWEGLVEDLSQELIEDICHQVLDLYSKQSQKREESPPITSEKSLHPPGKRNRNSPPQDDRGGPAKNPGGKAQKMDGSRAPSRSSSVEDSSRRSSKGPTDHTPSVQGVSSGYPGPPPSSGSRTTPGSSHPGPHQAYSGGDTSGYSQYNPYVSSQMFSSSFMSQEGSQSIQSLITGGDSGGQSHGGEYQQQYQQPPPSAYHPPGYSNNHPQPGPPYQVYSGYPPSTSSSSQPTAQQYQGGAQSYQNPPPQYNYGSDYSQPGGYPSSYHATSGQPFPPRFGAPGGPPRGPPPKNAKKKKDAPNKSTCLATVRITGR